MSSVIRQYAQRNNNKTQLVPELYSEKLSFDNIQNCAIYKLKFSQLQVVGGVYYVDLSSTDANGNLLDLSGTFSTLVDSESSIPIVCFVIDVDARPSYTGLEATIFFKNIPVEGLTIGILSSSSLEEVTIPVPYIVSPPFPPIAGTNINPNITLKGDGDNFNVVSSGPAGWLGYFALAAGLTFYLQGPL
jgi:hypothetical protein